MDETLTIRRETPEDYRPVEELMRRAFWNLYQPGAAEHYVAHVLRQHEDFVPELDLVAEADGRVVSAVMHTVAHLVAEDGSSARALTLGPVAVEPELQRRGIGKHLIEASFERARELGFEAIVLFGDPNNYVARGFVSCKKLGVCLDGGVHPAAMLVRELVPGALSGKSWTYTDSPALHIDPTEAERFDGQFPPMEKSWTPEQETFYILSNATLD